MQSCTAVCTHRQWVAFVLTAELLMATEHKSVCTTQECLPLTAHPPTLHFTIFCFLAPIGLLSIVADDLALHQLVRSGMNQSTQPLLPLALARALYKCTACVVHVAGTCSVSWKPHVSWCGTASGRWQTNSAHTTCCMQTLQSRKQRLLRWVNWLPALNSSKCIVVLTAVRQVCVCSYSCEHQRVCTDTHAWARHFDSC